MTHAIQSALTSMKMKCFLLIARLVHLTAGAARLTLGQSCLSDCRSQSGPSVIDMKPKEVSMQSTENLSFEFNNMPFSCVDLLISEPCVGHERRPALFWVKFTGPAGAQTIGPFNAYLAAIDIPGRSDPKVWAARLDVTPTQVRDAVALTGVAFGAGSTSDTTVAVHFYTADGPALPFTGLDGGDTLVVKDLPAPPPSPPPSPPPAPPAVPAPTVTMEGLQVWLDASHETACNGGSCANGAAPGFWTDRSGNGRDFANVGGIGYASETIAGETLGYFDNSQGSGWVVTTWTEWETAPSVTAEVWVKLKGYKSTNTGIVTHYISGTGKHKCARMESITC